jgi:hypothetical protein
LISDKKHKKKKMLVLITGFIDPFSDYCLDIKYISGIYSIHVERETKLESNYLRMGLDITPLLKKIYWYRRLGRF